MRRFVLLPLILSLLLPSFAPAYQSSAACDSVQTCRQLALEAAARGDFEAFHDFAWLAVRQGRPNDPELMYLLARAQSLSGRPGDALVMLRRLAALGVVTDADTHEDFSRVRALPAWPALGETLATMREAGPDPTAAMAPEPVSPRASAPGAVVKSPGPPIPSAAETAAPPAALLTIARRSFAPVGLAYDAVSRRFIAGDRHANKLMVLDEEFRRVNDLAAAASAGFFGLTAVAIDRRRGDLWVANAKEDGSQTALHRLQLISGRVLQVLPLPAEHGPATISDIALTSGGTVLALDTLGKRLFPVRDGSYQRPLPIDADTVRSIAAFSEQIAWIATTDGLARLDLISRRSVAIGGPRGVNLEGLVHIRPHRNSLVGIQQDGEKSRIVRLRFDATGLKLRAIEPIAEVVLADPTSISIDGNTLHYLARDDDGGTTMMHIELGQ